MKYVLCYHLENYKYDLSRGRGTGYTGYRIGLTVTPLTPGRPVGASGGQEVGTIHHRFIATPAPAHCQVVILTKFSSFYIYSTFIYVLTFN